jgi:PAS domain S-box-containing protein
MVLDEIETMSGVLNAITDPVLIIDRDFKILFANTASLDLCGVGREGIVGRNCREISRRCPLPCVLSGKCPLQEVFATGNPSRIKQRLRCSEGTERTFDVSVSPLKDAEGRVVQMIEVIKDITAEENAAEALRTAQLDLRETDAALEQSESLMAAVLESVGEGVIVIDPDYRIISANGAYCKLVKSTAEHILGKRCYAVSHHRDEPCLRAGEVCDPARTYRTGAPAPAVATHYDSEGKPVYVEKQSFPVKDRTGAVTAVIETSKNITEIRGLKEQLQHAQKMEAIGTLAGGIAHDFNNILSVIIGYGSLMQMNMRPDDRALPQVRQILVAGERAARLTTGLLAFSREQVMDLSAVKASAIVGDFSKMLEPIIGEDIEFRVVSAPEELFVQADMGQLEQVLMNLAVNARDAMPRGGTLTIETGTMSMDGCFINTHGFGQPGGYATIVVTDTGIGMDDATRHRIFEPYFTTKALGRGTGLGLSIAFGIVKQHKGFLECQSEPGKGTTFTIYLPVAAREAGQREVPEAAAPARGEETILIAEDDTSVRSFTRQLLNEFGYYVIEAVDGEDAVNKFKDNRDRVKMVLLDALLPKKTGNQAYEEIKALSPDIKTIFLSGYARDPMRDNDVRGAGPEFLQKPVSPMDLLNKIRATLDS